MEKIELDCLNYYSCKPLQRHLAWQRLKLGRRFWTEVLILVPLTAVVMFASETSKAEQHWRCHIVAHLKWSMVLFLSPITSDASFNSLIGWYQCMKIIDLLLCAPAIEAPVHQSFKRTYTLQVAKKSNKYSLVFTFLNYRQFALIQWL